MHVHILGICGTFMGGIAALAREMGHKVTGSDNNPYPPMSTQLKAQGIEVARYDPANLDPAPDIVVIGNALSRGNPEVEAVLESDLPYTSGPQWLAEHLLRGRWVLAVAGTHGKTTTSSMLAWILEYAGLEPGFLIGGVPENFGITARSGGGRYFVIEADEYDTAFFDKRSKFIHYHPRTLVLNNLEFDHADIFSDLDAIKQQFHFLIRTVPATGQLIINADDKELPDVLAKGCWSQQQQISSQLGTDANWQLANTSTDYSAFDVMHSDNACGRLEWSLIGAHNAANALAAIAAANHAGIEPAQAIEALKAFQNVKRRMEVRGIVNGITVYDDFAHHPTAIATTLDGLRRHASGGRIIAVLEPRSNTMRMGVHKDSLGASLLAADEIFMYVPGDQDWDTSTLLGELGERLAIHNNVDELIAGLMPAVQSGDHVLIMSNGGFEGIHDKILDRLADLNLKRSMK
ncbi:MAG TPA: UDP-N-acetylmuramate:L-alanyl-gamma-D-glutamyl-meso-diaminopimelate ligase [Gammaproteobacteria bacterium]|nr:UDP-N-acetylmuramate:L-alanyl-gamma-D-glutamyl-meso-diaminopimelate ligase [Gammaproteobacteria bacterium]